MPRKALVVEDDPNIAELIRLYLEKDGFEVHIAPDGKKGISEAGSYQPNIILLDIMLPEADGWEVCSEVREFSDVPGAGSGRLYREAL